MCIQASVFFLVLGISLFVNPALAFECNTCGTGQNLRTREDEMQCGISKICGQHYCEATVYYDYSFCDTCKKKVHKSSRNTRHSGQCSGGKFCGCQKRIIVKWVDDLSLTQKSNFVCHSDHQKIYISSDRCVGVRFFYQVILLG
jgi:hypothetical protein